MCASQVYVKPGRAVGVLLNRSRQAVVGSLEQSKLLYARKKKHRHGLLSAAWHKGPATTDWGFNKIQACTVACKAGCPARVLRCLSFPFQSCQITRCCSKKSQLTSPTLPRAPSLTAWCAAVLRCSRSTTPPTPPRVSPFSLCVSYNLISDPAYAGVPGPSRCGCGDGGHSLAAADCGLAKPGSSPATACAIPSRTASRLQIA